MRLITPRTWALVVLSALLQFAAFPIAAPLPIWRSALCWIALVPFFVALLSSNRTGSALTLRQSLCLGYLCGILWYLGNCYWMFHAMHLYGGMPTPVAFPVLVLFALYLGLYHALFAGIIAMVRSSKIGMRGAFVIAPFAWVAVELARARITFFPWDLLGYSQVDNLFVTRLAPFAGVMAISFVIAAVNAAMVPFFVERNKSRALLLTIALALAAVMQTAGRVGANYSDQNPSSTAVLLQENLEVGAMASEQKPLGLVQELGSFTDLSLHPTPGLSTPAPTVIVWPEAPSHLISDDPYFRVSIGHLARNAGSPVIAGSLGIDRDTSAPKGYFEYDSASLFTAAGEYSGRYDKIHLVPWGEYTPYPAVFGFVHKLTEGIGDMDIGHARTVFTTGGHTYGVFVCYESIFGDEVREFAKNGAEVLVNISDDGWYGDSGAPWQHLNMARMRAIENHRWVLRSTNTGITTAIDPQGRVALEAPRHVRGAFAFPFAFESATSTTFYTRHGDWFAWLCAAITAAAIATSLTGRKISLQQ